MSMGHTARLEIELLRLSFHRYDSNRFTLETVLSNADVSRRTYLSQAPPYDSIIQSGHECWEDAHSWMSNTDLCSRQPSLTEHQG